MPPQSAILSLRRKADLTQFIMTEELLKTALLLATYSTRKVNELHGLKPVASDLV